MYDKKRTFTILVRNFFCPYFCQCSPRISSCVPNAFSPNNDGHDDCFGLKYWGQISSLELTIYNRWGQLLFMTTDPQGCWDGTYKGVPQPAGGYVYQIKAATACEVAYRKGIVILVR